MEKRIGKWMVLEKLGRGGQGTVYKVAKAVNDGDGKPYALKQLNAIESAKARERFSREIAALEKVDHPQILKPLEVSADAKGAFYVMEYVEGSLPLSHFIWKERSRFVGDVFESMKLVAACADILASAHASGVVHRDLKPDNILIAPDGSVRVIDFGCCFIVENESAITLTDEGVGARNFMSPECESGSGETPDATCDVYSLGKILWSTITGQRPFAREKPGFSNKLLTALYPSDPHAGYAVDLMLKSVQSVRAKRFRNASELAAFAHERIELMSHEGRHPSFMQMRCPVCLGKNTREHATRIDGPLRLDVFCFLGNTVNNPHLVAKLCIDCGHVVLRDRRPIDEFEKRVTDGAAQ